MKNNLMAKISSTNELKTVGDISVVRKIIFDGLSDAELFDMDKCIFCYNTLLYFDFPALTKTDTVAIEKACTKVIALIGMEEIAADENAKLSAPLNRYMYYFLDLAELPGKEKSHLEAMVDADVTKVEGWINDYLTNYPFIQPGVKGRNHSERTIIDFYQRCVSEKDKILEYKLNGLKSRAMHRASSYREWNTGLAMFDWYKDRPYRLSIPRASKYFNHQNIDTVSHRILPIPIREGLILKDLYKTDKRKFYEEVDKKISPEGNIAQMVANLKWLPNVNPLRISAFEELEKLYKEKRYFSFYALGIPQVEGLFLDMCQLCSPTYHNPKASLSDKVEFTRNFCESSEFQLDYFKYHFPNNRNSFLHYGTTDKEPLELLCKDLLCDLVGALGIFLALNTEAIWLNRLLRSHDITNFASAEQFTEYFELVSKVKRKKQFHYFDSIISSMNETFFPEQIYNFAYGLEEKLDKLLESLLSQLSTATDIAGNKIDFIAFTNQEITDNSSFIASSLQEATSWILKDEFSEALHTKIFLKEYKNYFDTSKFETGLEKDLDVLYKKHSKLLSKISQIAVLTNFKDR